jgi:hypothetical protein
MSGTGASACWSCGAYGFPNADRTQCVCVGGAYVGMQGSSPTCLPCEWGSLSAPQGCYPCKAGTVCKPNLNVTGTTACATPSHYKANANSSCALCPSGRIVISNSTSKNNIIVTTQTCVPCPAGTYHSQQQCVPCPPNTYAASAGTANACAPCVSPLVSASGSTACVCPAGFYYYASACVPCLQACQPNASFVRRCSMGSVADSSLCACNGNSSSGDGMNAPCAPCPIPQGCGCARGYYFKAGGACVPCRTSCPYPAQLTGVCQKGTALQDTTTCVCPANTFWNGKGCARCRPCANNATAISYCVAGSTWDTSACACAGGRRGNGVTSCYN